MACRYVDLSPVWHSKPPTPEGRERIGDDQLPEIELWLALHGGDVLGYLLAIRRFPAIQATEKNGHIKKAAHDGAAPFSLHGLLKAIRYGLIRFQVLHAEKLAEQPKEHVCHD